MPRLIDADALINELNDSHCPGAPYVDAGISIAIGKVCDADTIEPQQWIPCSERLPEPDERVLVYTVGKEFHVWDAMPHRAESYAWEDEEGLYHSLYEVDLWMQLPEPYGGEA